MLDLACQPGRVLVGRHVQRADRADCDGPRDDARARVARAATDLTDEFDATTPGPQPTTAMVIAAVILRVALVALVLLIVATSAG